MNPAEIIEFPTGFTFIGVKTGVARETLGKSARILADHVIPEIAHTFGFEGQGAAAPKRIQGEYGDKDIPLVASRR